ncbi:hypothetical protein GN958_ATG03102 [Phytophthora infestans]|uniref:Uncharacterized protein n=1 Tax=Phytophthora infestans TaxID=4787 RepID=A0A8S9V6I8_PHYIN|nr:hypothetical protein GN958_ATG03102 [Phytophthora infestans]
MDLLDTCVVRFDEFALYEEQLDLDERPLHPIPVLLGRNETMIEYKRSFELWLAVRNVSLESIQGNPRVERLLRLDHSNFRYMKLRRQHFGTTTQREINYEESERSDTWKHNEELFPADYDEGRRFRSRSELLDWRLVSPEGFLNAMEDFGPNGRMYREEKLRPIAVVLRPGETSSGYELNFQRWLPKKNTTLEMLHDDPEEERRLRQCFAYLRAYELMNRRCAERDLCTPREVPVGRNHKRSRLQSEGDNVSSSQLETPSIGQSNSIEQATNGFINKPEDDTNSNASSTTVSELLYSPNDFDAEISDDIPKNEAHVPPPGAGDGLMTTASKEGVVKSAKSDIYDSAAKLFLKAKEIEVDSVERELASDYIRVCRQFSSNEAAINDHFRRGRTDLLVPEFVGSTQTDALPAALVQEKQRRDAALASLIAYKWRNEEDRPEQDKQSSAGDKAELPHDKIAAIYDKVLQNQDEMLSLRIKLSNRLSWLKATDTDRDAQFQELRDISKALDEKLTQNSRLHEQRRLLCSNAIQSDERIRMLQ